MRIKKDYVLRQIVDSWTVFPVADEAINFDGILQLNECGAMLWGVLEKDCSVEALVEALLKEYKVSEEEARADAEEFFEKLCQIGCIENV